MRNSVLGLMMITMALACPQLATAQAGPSSLKVSIAADRDSYIVGDPVNLEVKLRNTGDSILRVYSPEVSGVSEIKVIDAENALRTPRVAGVPVDPKEKIWEIPPGQERTYVYRNLRWNGPDAAYDFDGDARLGSNIYRIVLAFRSPPPEEKKIREGIWQGMMTSNLFRIKIFDKGQDHITCSDCQ